MKSLKPIAAIVALTLLITFVAQQAQAQKGLILGVRGGLNLATLVGEDVEEASMKPGLVAGGYGRYNFSDMFGVQLDALYSRKGASDDLLDVDLRLNYVELPLTFSTTFMPDGPFRPRVFAGPYIGFLAGASYDEPDLPGLIFLDPMDYYASVDLGWTAGLGFDFAMDALVLSFDARYSSSFTNIIDPDLGPLIVVEDQEAFNSVIGITLGVGYVIGN